MNGFHQGMQRGREGGFLRLACDVGLILSMILWIFAQLSLMQLAPPSGDVAEIALAVLRGSVGIVLALGCAVVLPALLAMITPLTPAGMLLQETRRSTWGFAVMIGAAGFLAYYAYQIVAAFWQASLKDAALAPMQTVATLIIGVVVPALAFSWSSPLTWLTEVEQAHQVKRLKMAHDAELAAMKAAYMRAVDKLRVGLANLTAAERQEVAGVLIGMQRAQNDALTAIAGTFRTLAGAELAVPTTTDAHLVQRYEQLAGLLEGRVLEIYDDRADATGRPDDTPEVASPFVPAPRTTVPHQDAERSRPVASAPASVPVPQGPPGTATGRPSDREALTAARAGLSGAWTRSDLEQCLSCAKTTASDLIRAWRSAGLVVELTDPRHHYSWTEAR